MDRQDEDYQASLEDASAYILTPQSTDSEQMSNYQQDTEVNNLLQDARFLIRFSSTPQDGGPCSTTEVGVRICYDPARGLCQFTCDTHDICLDSLTANEAYHVSHRDEQDIRPGEWRLSWYHTDTKAVLQVLGAFLISIRQFSISIAGNEAAEMHFPRTKVSVVVEPCPAEEPEALDEKQTKRPPPKRKTAYRRKRRFSEMENDQADETELERTAQTGQSTSDSPLTCAFQQNTGEIARSDAASLFAGYRSTLSSVDIVAKVMHRNKESLASVAQSFMHEAAVLKSLEHRNILKIHGYDTSLLTLYLEGLPPSLETRTKDVFPAIHVPTGLTLLDDDAETPFDESECVTILYDTCSALSHFKERGCFHNNIQPAHIAYSPERGAVLVGFGKATTTDNPQFTGCSPWSIPPESLQTRLGSAPGDVWALGIAMLYVLGKINNPEELVQAGPVFKADARDRADRSYKRWLAIVADIRCALDGTRTAECLVHAMLNPNPNDRIEARAIETLLRPHRERKLS